jgi:DNA mismatch endonuclease (patch repair protein)
MRIINVIGRQTNKAGLRGSGKKTLPAVSGTEKGTDIYSKQKRSELMSRVRSGNTKPEMLVRSALHSLGYRFRLHRKDLPGSPDVVLPKHRTAVFVHGCFWHQHPGCKKSTLPKQNATFWSNKLARNVEHDNEVRRKLEEAGWKVLVLWECEVKRLKAELSSRLAELLRPTNPRE